MLRWLESKKQWVIEYQTTRHGHLYRLFKRFPKCMGLAEEARAREWADITLSKFLAALDAQEEADFKAAGGGFLYVISHPNFPGMFKIGKTSKTPEARCEDLSGHLPVPCRVEHSIRVLRTTAAEAHVHRELAEFRVHPRREWFRVTVEQAAAVMEEAVDVGLPTTFREVENALKDAFRR